MANAIRPGIPAEASKIGDNVVDSGQPNNNMASFSPAPKKYANDGGSVVGPSGTSSLNDESEGTGAR